LSGTRKSRWTAQIELAVGLHQLKEKLNMKKLTFLAIVSASLLLSTAIVNAQTILSSTHAGQTGSPIAVTTPVGPGSFPFWGSLTDVVAANVDSEGQLKVIDWGTSTGTLVRKGDAIFTPPKGGGSPASISAAGLDFEHVATASVDAAGNLAINIWQIGCSSSVAVCLLNGAYASSYATTAYPFLHAVSITALSATQVVTASVNSTNNLEVQVWNINPTTYKPAAGPSYEGDLIQAVSVAAINSGQVVTAAQNLAGTVELTLFSNGSKGLTRAAPPTVGTSYAVTQVALAADLIGDIFTANIRATDGALYIVYWIVSSSGTFIPSATVHKGTGELQIAAAFVSGEVLLPITAMVDNLGNLDVDIWSTSKERSFHATTDAINSVALVPLGVNLGSPAVEYFATADRSATTGDLEIKLWSY
jgi:hypothetical protein